MNGQPNQSRQELDDVTSDRPFPHISRRAAVPSDQRKLLDKPESWASSLRFRSHGTVNLPGTVLVGIQRFHEQQHSKSQPVSALTSQSGRTDEAQRHDIRRTSSQSSGEDNKPSDVPSTPKERTRMTNTAQDTKISSGSLSQHSDGEDDGSQLSWSQSPESRRFLPKEEGKAQTSKLPKVVPAVIPTFPSSPGTQEELDLEVPGALSIKEPVNKAGMIPISNLESPARLIHHTGDTPPNGQGTQIVPSTYDTPLPQQPTPTRRMKRMDFTGRAWNILKQGVSPAIRRLAPMMAPPPVPTASSYDSGPSSSVVIESSIHAQLPCNSSTARHIIPSSNLGEQFLSQEVPSRIHETILTSSASASGLETEAPPPSLEGREVTETRIEETKINSSVRSAPKLFDVYKAAYPDYPGDVADFVRACYIMKILRRKKALSSYLYDDFIRTFGSSYMTYVEGCGKNDKIPTSAIEWYNDQIEEPVYLSRVMSKHNLDQVLITYPVELAAVKQVIHDSQSTNSGSPEHPGTAQEVVVTEVPEQIEMTKFQQSRLGDPKPTPSRASLPTEHSVLADFTGVASSQDADSGEIMDDDTNQSVVGESELPKLLDKHPASSKGSPVSPLLGLRDVLPTPPPKKRKLEFDDAHTGNRKRRHVSDPQSTPGKARPLVPRARLIQRAASFTTPRPSQPSPSAGSVSSSGRSTSGSVARFRKMLERKMAAGTLASSNRSKLAQ